MHAQNGYKSECFEVSCLCCLTLMGLWICQTREEAIPRDVVQQLAAQAQSIQEQTVVCLQCAPS